MVASLFYLGLLFTGAGYVYGYIQHFSGSIVIPLGHTESTVVRPAEPGAGFSPMQRSLPAEVILFDNPEDFTRRLDPALQYDAAHMPFHLRLDEARVLKRFPPRNRLTLRTPQGRERVVTARPSARIEFAGREFEVAAVRPWAGLIRRPGEHPMASLFLRDEPGAAWNGPVFLRENAWRWMAADVALLLRWFPGEEAARQALPEKRPGPEAGYWSVREGQRAHRFDSLAPGAGVELNNGLNVTLLKLDPAHTFESGVRPAIAVGFEHNGEKEAVWVPANSANPVRGVRFHYPGAARLIAHVHAWRDGAAHVQVFCGDGAFEPRRVEPGDILPEDADCPPQLRLGQVMASALSVPATGKPVWELVLRAGGETVALREGQSAAHEGVRLTYVRVPEPPRVEYALTALRETGETLGRFTLSPGDPARQGAWRFRYGGENADADKTAVLHAERTLGSRSQRVGMLMMVAGAFGWVVARMLHRARRRNAASDGRSAVND